MGHVSRGRGPSGSELSPGAEVPEGKPEASPTGWGQSPGWREADKDQVPSSLHVWDAAWTCTWAPRGRLEAWLSPPSSQGPPPASAPNTRNKLPLPSTRASGWSLHELMGGGDKALRGQTDGEGGITVNCFYIRSQSVVRTRFPSSAVTLRAQATGGWCHSLPGFGALLKPQAGGW